MTQPFTWLPARPRVMGVLNVTPDSFSDGGRFLDPKSAVAQAREIAAAGAEILDVGGESTRPGAQPVEAGEELRRVIPVIEQIAGEDFKSPISNFKLLLSIDTSKAVVAERALAAGARIVNDVSALRADPRMADVVRESGAGLIVMHAQGNPRTMQQDPRYGDVVAEVREELGERIAFALDRGIGKSQIAVDPGIGFGKTAEHNLQLLARLETFRSLGCAVVVGTSRKSFLGKVLADPPTGIARSVDQRLWGTAATVAWAVAQGATVVRVHDVAEMVDVVRMTRAILDCRF